MTNIPGESSFGAIEAAQRLGLIKLLHGFKDNAVQRDELLFEARIAGVINRRHKFVIESPDSEYVPVSHYRLMIMPAGRNALIKDIEKMFVRIPMPTYDDTIEQERHAVAERNDVFIEFVGKGNEPKGRYLLNSLGLSQYETIAEHDGDLTTDIIFNVPDNAQFTGDYFIASAPQNAGDSEFRPTVNDISQILQEYTLGPQDTTLD